MSKIRKKNEFFLATFNTICHFRLLLKLAVPCALWGVDISWTTGVCVKSNVDRNILLLSLNVSRAHIDIRNIVWTNFTPQERKKIFVFWRIWISYYFNKICVKKNVLLKKLYQIHIYHLFILRLFHWNHFIL